MNSMLLLCLAGLTGKVRVVFSAEHRLFAKTRACWTLAVKDVFAVMSGSDVWPPPAAPQELVAAALQFDPSSVQLYRGLKIMRRELSHITLQCNESFHGHPRFDTVQLNREPGSLYDDVHEFEFGLVHCFFVYNGAGLRNFLTWGASHVPYGLDAEAVASQGFFHSIAFFPCCSCTTRA